MAIQTTNIVQDPGKCKAHSRVRCKLCNTYSSTQHQCLAMSVDTVELKCLPIILDVCSMMRDIYANESMIVAKRCINGKEV